MIDETFPNDEPGTDPGPLVCEFCDTFGAEVFIIIDGESRPACGRCETALSAIVD